MYLYVFSVAGSAIALALSLRGLIRSYQAVLNSISGPGKTIILGAAAVDHNLGQQGHATPESYYSPAEREIIDLIRDHGGSILQSSLVSASTLSSATVSRTITALENKGVLLRIRKGVTNELHLVESNFR
ncbi:MAG: MarR family transcriptional regulator [Thermoplasmatales archaeon]|nr:MarR family transcriptional regulator [Thermoplasmatales archaeon]